MQFSRQSVFICCLQLSVDTDIVIQILAYKFTLLVMYGAH